MPIDQSERFTYGPDSADSHDRFRYSPDYAVLLLVGDDEENMLVHSRYVAECSEFFKAALKTEWKEGQTRVVKLPEECPVIMEVYLDFVYKRTLPTSPVTTAFRQAHNATLHAAYGRLIDLYLLGDRLLDNSIRNAVSEEIIRIASLAAFPNASFPSATYVNKIYANTLASSPVRRLLVDLHVSYATSTALDQGHNPSFIHDLAIAVLLKAERRASPWDFRQQTLLATKYFL